MCDLDNFKNINDTYGHIAGDKMLLEFVNIVKKELASDIFRYYYMRYGGEEFLLILPASPWYDIQGKEVLQKTMEEILNSYENFILNYKNQCN